jgi:NTE family protein
MSERSCTETCGGLPVSYSEAAEPPTPPQAGIALCLSGGGYRAMLFHVGAIWRLNDAGLLPRLDRISSVSGGSITAGVLGLAWNKLGFDAQGVGTCFADRVVAPLRALAAKTIDRRAIMGGLLLPCVSISEKVAAAYRKHLFGAATLQSLPDRPRFVINATNVQSGVLWRFAKPYMRDYRVGEIKNPQVPLAQAVAASSAFPPVLSPMRLRLSPSDFTPNSGHDLHHEPFTRTAVLTDGGVYDNLGLETAWKRYDTILVSDAGAKTPPQGKPNRDWIRHAIRILDIVDNQVRSLRKRQLIDSYESGLRKGTYWGIGTDIAHYRLPDAFACPTARTHELAETPTRLRRMDAKLQERLINWGYAVCDAALRKHFDPSLARPETLPYRNTSV